jgi:hypothetical protein
MIKDSLGQGVRFVEYMRPGEAAAAAGAADAAAEGGEEGAEDVGGDVEAAAAADAAEGEEAAAVDAGGESDAAAAADGAAAAAGDDGGSQEQGEKSSSQPAAAGGEEGGEEELRFLVRFQTPEDAAAAVTKFDGSAAAADGSKQVAGLPATLRAVGEEEEAAFHQRVSKGAILGGGSGVSRGQGWVLACSESGCFERCVGVDSLFL